MSDSKHFLSARLTRSLLLPLLIVAAGPGSYANRLEKSTEEQPLPEMENLKVSFQIDCSTSISRKMGDGRETTSVTLRGNTPFYMSRDHDKMPLLGMQQIYPPAMGVEDPVSYHAEYRSECHGTDCRPCHFTYDGPMWVAPAIMHDPQDPVRDWKAQFNATGLQRYAADPALGSNTHNLEPGCLLAPEEATLMLLSEAQMCFSGPPRVPFKLTSGEKIVFRSDDPDRQLDSEATFSFSAG
jgi:hypothetical protein